ncbi:MAG: class I SAM-dependent methyltransferase [Phycisphaerae bacterium]
MPDHALAAYQDAFGHALWDMYRGRGGDTVIERDDGLTDAYNPGLYFKGAEAWPAIERRAVRLARGRVLDIGCGPGRVCLHIQAQRKKGLSAVGIDNSPLAIRTCRRRGVEDARAMSIDDVGPDMGVFDTILMFGNNFGLMGSFAKARRLLRTFHRMTSPRGRIIAAGLDPYRTARHEHLTYHRRNRRRGRMSGQLRIRVWYKQFVTPWFDYLFVSKRELARILRGTGWRVARYIEARNARKDPNYVAVIEKA